MVTAKFYEQQDKDTWDKFVDTCKSPLFLFKRNFMEYHADRFIDNSIIFYKNDSIIAVLPASKHKQELISHGGLTYGGLLLGNKLRASTVLEVVKQLISLMAHNNLEKLTYKAIPYIFHKYAAEEDLYAIFNCANAKLVRRDVSSAIYLEKRLALSKGRKWLISRAKKNNLNVIKSTNWEGFYNLLSEVLNKHSTKPVHSAHELALLSRHFPKNIELNVILFEQKIIAGAVLFKFQNVVHTQYLSVSEIGKELGALDLLIEQVIQESVSLGYKYFNFGISTENNGKNLNSGLIEQKESFGARAITLDFYEINLNDN